MQLPKGALVAVADGQKLSLFRNSGDEANPNLVEMSGADVDTDNKGSGARHRSTSANPDDSQIEEDSFAAGVVENLNKRATSGKLEHLVVVAAPRTLGEMRKHYHATLSKALVGEIAKDLTGHSLQDIEKAIAAA